MKNLISTLFIFTLMASTLFAQSDEVPNKQMSLVTKHTATWCPICGFDAWDTQKYFMDNLDGKDAFVLTAHISGSSKLYSDAARDLLDNFEGVIFQPEFYFNTTKISGGDIQAKMVDSVSQAAMQTPLAQAMAEATYNPETDTFRVNTTVQFFSNAETSGDYRVSVFLVEKEVIEEQASRGDNEMHQNVLRASLIEDFYSPAMASGTIEAGTQASHQVAVKWDERYDMENTRVLVILWERNGNNFSFVNVNATETIEMEEETTTSSRNIDALAGRFAILPNATYNTARIQLDLPQAHANAEMLLFDQYGRVVRTLHRGAMPAGEQTLQLDRESLATGMYFVRFRAGGTLATRRVVFF